MLDLNDKVFKKALDKWGVRAQMNVAIEEMAELMVDINHWKRKRIKLDKLMEEVVDVSIMMRQLRFLDKDLYEKIYQEKVDKIVKKVMK